MSEQTSVRANEPTDVFVLGNKIFSMRDIHIHVVLFVFTISFSIKPPLTDRPIHQLTIRPHIVVHRAGHLRAQQNEKISFSILDIFEIGIPSISAYHLNDERAVNVCGVLNGLLVVLCTNTTVCARCEYMRTSIEEQ